MTRNSGKHLRAKYGKYWTAVSTLFGLISSNCVLCKEYGCNFHDIFRLIGRAIAMTFGIDCVRCGSVVSSRDSPLHSVVTGSISSGGNHCWWELIRLKQLSSVSVCRAQVFAGFFCHGNSRYNITPLLKKENVYQRPRGCHLLILV